MDHAKQGSAATARVPFKEMPLRQKLLFICKLTILICSFGFIFPHLLND
jgi:hypothetical protein